jgi:hypothetical protein
MMNERKHTYLVEGELDSCRLREAVRGVMLAVHRLPMPV